MALDTRIPLLGQTIGPQTLVNASNLRQADTQNELQRFALQQQKDNQPLVAAQRDRDLQLAHLQRNVALSERLRTFVDAGDTKGGLQFLQGVREPLRAAGQQTPLIDAYIGDLESNNTDGLNSKLNEARQTGERIEMLQPTKPNTVRRIVSGSSQVNAQWGLGIPEEDDAVVEFTLGQDGNPVSANVASGFGGQRISLAPDPWEAARAGNDVEWQNATFAAGQAAVTALQNVEQLANFIVDPNTQTGAAQPAVLALQGLAEDFGINLQQIASRMNINVGELANKEEFNRISRTIIIDGFEKFKGNLNQKEVDLAIGAFANLGVSEDGNMMAIASLRAANEIARTRGYQAVNAGSQAEVRSLMSEMLLEDTDQFVELRGQYLNEMQTARRAGSVPSTRQLPPGVPEGSQFLGVRNGFEVYQFPDGQVVQVGE